MQAELLSNKNTALHWLVFKKLEIEIIISYWKLSKREMSAKRGKT